MDHTFSQLDHPLYTRRPMLFVLLRGREGGATYLERCWYGEVISQIFNHCSQLHPYSCASVVVDGFEDS